MGMYYTTSHYMYMYYTTSHYMYMYYIQPHTTCTCTIYNLTLHGQEEQSCESCTVTCLKGGLFEFRKKIFYFATKRRIHEFAAYLERGSIQNQLQIFDAHRSWFGNSHSLFMFLLNTRKIALSRYLWNTYNVCRCDERDLP